MKKIQDILKEKAIGFVFNLASLLVIVIILLLVIYAFAAFTEPSAAPSASNQDFAQNILGADNANNSFASTNVVANGDGSIIERLENLIVELSYTKYRGVGTTDIGGVTGSITGSVPEMIDYLWDNRTSFGASTSWTQCAYFADTAGDDITGTWDNGCASYKEVIFACEASNRRWVSEIYQTGYGIGSVNYFTVYDANEMFLDFSPVVRKQYETWQIYGTDGSLKYLYYVWADYTNDYEGAYCGGNTPYPATGDKYWIYGR